LALKINENLKIPLHEIEGGRLYYKFKTVFNELTKKEDERFPHEINVEANVEKIDNDYLLQLSIKTKAILVCDRCGEQFIKKISESLTILSSFKKSSADNQGIYGIKFLSAHSQEIGISQEVFDQVLLAIPQKVLCKNDCKGLCSKCGINLNITTCKCKKDNIDPEL